MNLRELTPRFIEHSKLPIWLSKIMPIRIDAIVLGYWVFGAAAINKTIRRHEAIHLQQSIELLFVGFWILYALFFFWGLLKYRNGLEAYARNPLEREAFGNERKLTYLKKRKRYAWAR